LDSTSGYYITDYVKANYLEVIGEKEKALEAYLEIKSNKSMDHYHHYRFALKRIDELSKSEPILLDELFYPSLRSDKEICITDNKTRTKIFDIISALPEIKSLDKPYAMYIYQEPEETKSSNYWIKVNSQYDFFVDTSSFVVTYFDKNNDEQISLTKWRKKNDIQH